MRTRLCFFLFILLGLSALPLRAQPDPARAGAVVGATVATRKVMGAQTAAITATSGMYYDLDRKLKKINKFKKKYEEYLDSMQNMLAMAASIYGIYYECTQSVRNVAILKDIFKEQPTSVLAVALYPERNAVYMDMMTQSLDVVNDFYSIFVRKEMAAEHDRYLRVERTRRKLRKYNDSMRRFCVYLSTTTLLDVWNKVLSKAERYQMRSHREVAEQALRDWHRTALSHSRIK